MMALAKSSASVTETEIEEEESLIDAFSHAHAKEARFFHPNRCTALT